MIEFTFFLQLKFASFFQVSQSVRRIVLNSIGGDHLRFLSLLNCHGVDPVAEFSRFTRLENLRFEESTMAAIAQRIRTKFLANSEHFLPNLKTLSTIGTCLGHWSCLFEYKSPSLTAWQEMEESDDEVLFIGAVSPPPRHWQGNHALNYRDGGIIGYAQREERRRETIPFDREQRRKAILSASGGYSIPTDLTANGMDAKTLLDIGVEPIYEETISKLVSIFAIEMVGNRMTWREDNVPPSETAFTVDGEVENIWQKSHQVGTCSKMRQKLLELFVNKFSSRFGDEVDEEICWHFTTASLTRVLHNLTTLPQFRVTQLNESIP